MNRNDKEAGIPVLTEVVLQAALPETAADDVTATTGAQESAPAPAEDSGEPALHTVAADLPAPAGHADELEPEQKRMPAPAVPHAVTASLDARDLSEQVMQRVQARLPALLDIEVRDRLDEVLLALSASLSAEIGRTLPASLARLVSEAVAEELEKRGF